MNAAYDKLIQHLDEKNIGYWSHSENCTVMADLRGTAAVYRVYAQVDAENHLFQVWGWSPVLVPPGARPAIAETLHRANHGLWIGKFELDYDSGDFRYQAAQILPEDQLDDDTIQRMIGTTVSMLDAYLPAVLSVVYANELPADAVKQAEPGSGSHEEET